jgi:GntR family carbon starvation induced transcriptional regulator
MTDSRDNTASKILDSLKNDIISGEYLPKQKLHIKTLKEKYNVGTSPLREALSQLMANDLVVSKNQRGFYVSDISLEDLTDIYQTRAKIESLCIEMSIDKGDDYWEANLIAASHRLNKYSKKDKLETNEWQSRHSDFHEALVSGCNSPRLFQIRSSLIEKSKRYRSLWLKENVSNVTTLKINQNEHAALMILALERDKKAISKLIEEHIMTPVGIIKKSLSQL